MGVTAALLGGAEVWVVAPTCYILRMPIIKSMTTAGVFGPMTDTISSSGIFDLSVGSLEVS